MALPQPTEGTDWTIETLRQHFIEVLATRDRVMAEMDRRYQERFEAQSKALDAAFLAADRAVQAALSAAEKAVTKAEVAAEKRFDSVNEFRQAYQDIIAQQMPRAEAEQRLAQMAEAISELKQGSSQAAGHHTGATDTRTESRQNVGALVAIAVLVVLVIGLVLTQISRG